MAYTKPYNIHLGNCLEVLKGIPDNSVDSIVTDPPYGLSFMGKSGITMCQNRQSGKNACAS